LELNGFDKLKAFTIMTLNLSIGIEHKRVNPAKMKSILKQLRSFSSTSNSSIEVLKPKKPQRDSIVCYQTN